MVRRLLSFLETRQPLLKLHYISFVNSATATLSEYSIVLSVEYAKHLGAAAATCFETSSDSTRPYVSILFQNV